MSNQVFLALEGMLLAAGHTTGWGGLVGLEFPVGEAPGEVADDAPDEGADEAPDEGSDEAPDEEADEAPGKVSGDDPDDSSATDLEPGLMMCLATSAPTTAPAIIRTTRVTIATSPVYPY